MKKEKSYPKFYVKKRTLLAIAGTVWFLAGINVARLGLIAYSQHGEYSQLNLFLSLLVFMAFGTMFYKMSIKHSKRIDDYEEEIHPPWSFFDLKDYMIMITMMSFGIWLRSSGLVSIVFIAFFYTGLGLALASVGIYFWYMYFRRK